MKLNTGLAGWAEGSMAISFVVLLAGYLLSVPLPLLLGYMAIATTIVLVALGRSLREHRRWSRDTIVSESRSSNPYQPPESP